MSSIIKDFYSDNRIPKLLISQKLSKFEKNPDIAKEFEVWIRDNKFISEGAVEVEGYTAKKLVEISEYLNGEGAFLLLIELRDNPRRAKERIKEGFKRK